MVTQKKQPKKGEYPVIHVDMGKPISGFWDGGPKQIFDFTPSPKPEFIPGTKIEWGSWSANFFFTTSSGRSWNEAASIAKKWIKNNLKQTPKSITIVWQNARYD
jgi:hypothetical protein